MKTIDQQLQPSEIAKIAVILFIPVLMQMGKEIKTLRGIGQVLLWGGLLLQPASFFLEIT